MSRSQKLPTEYFSTDAQFMDASGLSFDGLFVGVNNKKNCSNNVSQYATVYVDKFMLIQLGVPLRCLKWHDVKLDLEKRRQGIINVSQNVSRLCEVFGDAPSFSKYFRPTPVELTAKFVSGRSQTSRVKDAATTAPPIKNQGPSDRDKVTVRRRKDPLEDQRLAERKRENHQKMEAENGFYRVNTPADGNQTSYHANLSYTGLSKDRTAYLEMFRIGNKCAGNGFGQWLEEVSGCKYGEEKGLDFEEEMCRDLCFLEVIYEHIVISACHNCIASISSGEEFPLFFDRLKKVCEQVATKRTAFSLNEGRRYNMYSRCVPLQMNAYAESDETFTRNFRYHRKFAHGVYRPAEMNSLRNVPHYTRDAELLQSRLNSNFIPPQISSVQGSSQERKDSLHSPKVLKSGKHVKKSIGKETKSFRRRGNEEESSDEMADESDQKENCVLEGRKKRLQKRRSKNKKLSFAESVICIVSSGDEENDGPRRTENVIIQRRSAGCNDKRSGGTSQESGERHVESASPPRKKLGLRRDTRNTSVWNFHYE